MNNELIKFAKELGEVEKQSPILKTLLAFHIAKSSPRDEETILHKINHCCSKMALAKKSEFEINIKGSKEPMTGPTIHLVREIAKTLGHIEFGYYITDQEEKKTHYTVWAHDLQENTKVSRSFIKKHRIWKKDKGYREILDDDSIYRLVASDATKRLRSVLESVIPAYLIEAALKKCRETMNDNSSKEALDKKIQNMLAQFANLGVSKEMILKKYAQINIKAMMELGRIYNSIRDGEADIESFFQIQKKSKQESGDKEMFNFVGMKEVPWDEN